MPYSKIIEEIQKLPHYREYTCSKCGKKQQVFTLIIHGECIQCGTKYKFRGVTPIGSEVEDVIDAVLEWTGKGTEFDEAMKWKIIIDSSD
jgi:transcription elongation factor Elf1